MSKKDGDEIIAWIESQPELDYIRIQANKTLCDYRIDKTELSERLVVNSREDLSLNKETFFQKILSTFWVPGANLRGSQVASKELDGSLDTTAKVMSVSTIWDFACTLPIFTYAVGGIARGLAGPTGFALGFIILWASNITGENSTNKTRGNKGKAKASLIAFLILSLAKTAVSGVGIEMLISKDSIIENFADELIQEKSVEEDKATKLALDAVVQTPSVSRELQLAEKQCNDIAAQKASLDMTKRSNKRIWKQLDERAYIGEDAPCAKVTKLSSVYSTSAGEKQKALDANKKVVLQRIEHKNQWTKIQYLNNYYPNIYRRYFNGTPPSAYTFVDKTTFDGIYDKGEGNVEWRDGEKGTAIATSTSQFFEKISNNEFASLGLSLFAFIISVILTSTAAILLYTTGKNTEVKASFSSVLGQKSNSLLSTYRDDLESEN